MAFNYNGNKIYVGAEFDEQKLRTQFDGAIKSLSNDKSKLIKVNVDGKESENQNFSKIFELCFVTLQTRVKFSTPNN